MSAEGRPVRLGIVGLQHLHPRFYMGLFRAVPDVLPVAVAESDRELRQSFCTDFGLTGYGSVQEMLRNEALDAAALFLPHADFPAAAVECARKGLHLMVDKPMAADARGAERIVQAAEENEVQHTTGYYFRLHPVAAEVRELVQSGAVGRVVSGDTRWLAGGVSRYRDGGAGWMLDRDRSGGGPLHNLGVHWIDMLRFVLADEVAAACGRTVRLNEEYTIEDVCTAQLEFSRGALISLQTAYIDSTRIRHRSPPVHFSLTGTRGMISWEPFGAGEMDRLTLLCDDPRFSDRSREIDAADYLQTVGRGYVQAFADAVRGKRPMFVTGHDGVAALRAVDAVYRSARTLRWERTDAPGAA